MNKTFEEAKIIAAALYAVVDQASAALQVFPKGPMGLTPDAVKFSPEFQLAKKNYDIAFQALRKFNAEYTKQFKQELAAERAQKREVLAMNNQRNKNL